MVATRETAQDKTEEEHADGEDSLHRARGTTAIHPGVICVIAQCRKVEYSYSMATSSPKSESHVKGVSAYASMLPLT